MAATVAPYHRQPPPPAPRSPTLSISMIQPDGDGDALPRHAVRDANALPSSPTVQDSLLQPRDGPGARGVGAPRRHSDDSSSISSEDLEHIPRWPGLDAKGGFDDSGVDLEDDDEADQLPGEAGEATGNGEQADANDKHYSSDLYSRRAEIILANAKKRLNVMEGNLRGARQSLVVSPTLGTSASDLCHQLSVTRERDRRLYAGMGPIPPRVRPYHSQSPAMSSSGHARGVSETSVPLPFASPNYLTRSLSNRRSSSAMGMDSGPWTSESQGQRRFPIRESRSFETMRAARNGSPPRADRDRSLPRARSRGSRSPPHHLETLLEDDSAALHRSTSTTSGLRDRLNDLNGRISTLKSRAQEDHLRRRSMQSLRAPSPFTSADSWYADAATYQHGGSPVARDAGIGTRNAFYQNGVPDPPLKGAGATPTSSYGGAVQPVDHESEGVGSDYNHGLEHDRHAVTSEGHAGGNSSSDGAETAYPLHDEDEDELDAGSESVYEDAVYEMPETERHEDRHDAFDYENFFLHSAMGTYSRERRHSDSSGSDASGDSAATTRPVVSAQNEDDDTSEETPRRRRASYHLRNASQDSVSTLASFATAAEDQSDEEDDENQHMDQFSQQFLPIQSPDPSASYFASSGAISPRPDSATITTQRNGEHMLHTAFRQKSHSNESSIDENNSDVLGHSRGFSETSTSSYGTEAASWETNHGGSGSDDKQISDVVALLLGSSLPSSSIPQQQQQQKHHRLQLRDEEEQLIRRLVTGLRQACERLGGGQADEFERRQWRRRLDGAGRALGGAEEE